VVTRSQAQAILDHFRAVSPGAKEA
jgi:hypothetical protein